MEERLRSWWQKIKQHPFIAAGIIVALFALIAFTIAVYKFGWDWTGFNGGESKITIISASKGTTTAKELQPARAFWDWLGLLAALAVPVVVGIGATWFTAKQGQVSDREKTDNQRETALQGYIDKMSQLLLHEGLRESVEDGDVRKIARVRSLTLLQRLDADRKRSVLEFLHESHLIAKGRHIVDLTEADLSRANLSGVMLNQAILSGIDLSGANLNGAKLIEADLSGANLNGAKLRGTDLSEAILRGTDLIGAILNEAILSRANLRGAKLIGAKLIGANLYTTNYLQECNLSGANLSGIYLEKANLRGAKLSRANLSRANLKGADLSEANLSRANLKRADLSEANLSGANLEGANLSGSNLKGANLKGANRSGALVTAEQLATVKSP